MSRIIVQSSEEAESSVQQVCVAITPTTSCMVTIMR